jgi:prophage regulatory protein
MPTKPLKTFLRLKQVIAVTGLSRSSIYAMILENKFPHPIKLGSKAVAWDESELASWQAARIAARDASVKKTRARKERALRNVA